MKRTAVALLAVAMLVAGAAAGQAVRAPTDTVEAFTITRQAEINKSNLSLVKHETRL